MRIHRLLGTCAFAALLTFGATSHADDDALSDTARELFVKGVKAFEQGKWDQCRAALLAAFAIKHHAQVAGNLADCELKLGKPRDAAEHAWFFLHALRPDAPAERRASAEALLKEAQQKVGTVQITVDVDGAEVLVDGQSAGKAPLAAPVFVEPGRHTVEALRAGDVGAQVTVDAGAGETREVALALRKKEGPVVPAVVPVVEKRPLWPVVVMGGVGGVALAGGIGLFAAAGSKATTVRDEYNAIIKAGHSCVVGASNFDPKCDGLHGSASTGDTLHNAGIGMLAVTGAAVVGAVVYMVWPHANRAESRVGVRLIPAASPTDAGLLFSGTF